MQVFEHFEKSSDAPTEPSARLNLLTEAQSFIRDYADGVMHPLAASEKSSKHDSNIGHIAGQLTDATVVSLVASKLPFFKSVKGAIPELESQSSRFAGESFLHAPASLVTRDSKLEKTFARAASHSLNDIQMDAESYSLTNDASHLIESVHVEPTTYKMTRPGNPREHVEKTESFKYYKLKGLDTRIGMPLHFADSLEPIRSARLKSSQLEGFERDAFDTRRSANLHGYDSAILPEQTAMFLRELPNPALAKELLLIPQADAKAGAAIDRDNPGRIQLFNFKRFLDPYINTAEAPFYLRHEWSHLSEFENPSLATAFRVARSFEKTGFFAHETAVESASEDWAVHLGENLMDPDAAKFLETIDRAPMRSLVLLQSLKQELAKGAEFVRTQAGADDAQSIFANPTNNPLASQLRARVEVGEQMLLPEVRSILRKRIDGGNPGWKVLSHRYASLMRNNGLELLSSD